MKFSILLLSIFVSCSIVKGQTLSEAYNTYNELKEGVLLVRLEDYHNAIEKYEDAGYESKAKELKEASKSETDWIIGNFKRNYKFSAYAFFYARNIDEVLQNQPVEYFDVNGNTVSIPDETPRFICKKEILHYTAGSMNKYYHIYGIKNEALYKIPEPFRTDYRIPLFIRLFNKEKYQNEVEYLNNELLKEYDKLKRKLKN
jgi:hypothetical protein